MFILGLPLARRLLYVPNLAGKTSKPR